METTYHTLAEDMAGQWNNFLPGIDRVIFIGGNNDYGQWVAGEWLRKGNSYHKKELALPGNVPEKLLEARKQKSGYQWISRRQIPFFIQDEEKKEGQLSLFDEKNYLVLVIRIKLPDQKLTDVFYLFFRNDKSNFGISHDSSPIDTSQKNIIGTMAVNFARIHYNTVSEKNSELGSVKTHVKELLEYHADRLKAATPAGPDKWKRDWAEETLLELSQRDGINYVYREETIKLLSENSYPYKKLKQALYDAIRVAKILAPGHPGKIFIEPYYIKFTDVNNGDKDSETGHAGTETLITRMDKAYRLLDRLEEAAQKLLSSDVMPTSEKVGKAMEQPVTAPAIRDALKKHRARVLHLLDKYPQRWPYIRNQFRPVTNLLPKNNPLGTKAV